MDFRCFVFGGLPPKQHNPPPGFSCLPLLLHFSSRPRTRVSVFCSHPPIPFSIASCIAFAQRCVRLRPCVMYTLLADPPALRRPPWLILHKPRRPAGAGGFYRHLYTSYTNPGGIPQGARRYFVIQKLASGFQNGTALKASTRGSLCMKMRRGCCGTRR